MNGIKLLALLFACQLVVGCNIEDSADVNQDRIWTRYELMYDKAQDKTFAVAEFRLDNSSGTVLELNEAASISFEGYEMTYKEEYLGHYAEIMGLVDSGAFVYTDLDQVTFTNPILGLDTVAFPAGFDTISTGTDNVLEWVGAPLMANENVSVFLNEWSWGAEPTVTESAENASEVIISASNLSAFTESSITVYLDRWIQSDAVQTTSKGGVVIGRYRAINQQVELVN